MRRLRAAIGVRFAGGWVGWLSFAIVFMSASAVLSATPAYVESVGDVLADDSFDSIDADDPAVTFRTWLAVTETIGAMPDTIRTEIGGIGGLDPVVTTIAIGTDRSVVRLGDLQASGRVLLMTRPGAVDAIEKVATGGPEDGMWIPESVAASLGAEPGDVVSLVDRYPAEIALDFGDRAPDDLPGAWAISIPVAGTYRDLDPSMATGYFASIPPEIKPLEFIVFGGRVDPQLLIMEEADLVARLLNGNAVDGEVMFGEPVARGWWQAPLASGVGGIDQLRQIADDITALDRATNDSSSTLGATILNPGFALSMVESDLPDVRDRVEGALDTIGPSVDAVALAAGATAMVVILLGAWFVTSRQRRELRLLAVEGRPPWSVAAAAAVAVALPAVIGFAGGAWVAPVLVRTFGPSDRVHVTGLSVIQTIGFLAVGLALVGLAFWMAYDRSLRVAPRTGRPRWIWDIALYGAAATLLFRVFVLDDSAGTESLDVVRVLVPIVVGAALVALVIRAVSALITRFRGRGSRLPLAAFLAWRRIAATAAHRLGIILPIGAAVAVGVFSSVLVASIDRGLESKAIVAVGGEVVIRLGQPLPAADIPEGSMQIRAGSGQLSSSDRVWVVMVDADQYADVVPWNDDFGDTIDVFVDALTAPTTDRVPAVVAGPGSSALLEGSAFRFQRLTTQFDAQLAFEAVPQMSALLPTVVIDEDSFAQWAREHPTLSGLDRFIPEGLDDDERAVAFDEALDSRQLFVGLTPYLVAPRGTDVAALSTQLGDVRVVSVETIDELVADPAFTGQRWAFGYLRLQSIIAEVIAFAVLAFALIEARQRSLLARGFLTRMGAGRTTLAVSGVLEVAGLIVLALVAGSLAGFAVAGVLLDGFDPLAAIPPSLVLTVDLAGLATLAWVAVVVGVAVWFVAERTGRTRDLGRALRG